MKENEGTVMSLHDGHRQRMYEKVAKEGLFEHEWLEVLLYAAIPRRNTNDIAHRLIQRFGSVMAVLEASMEELQAVTGIGKSAAAHLKCIYHFYKEYHNHAVRAYDGRFDSRSFLPYVKKTYETLPYEVVDLYLLDGDGQVIEKQGFSIESICTVRMVPEEITRYLLKEDAHGVVMVHNHLGGNATPSKHDDIMTKNIQMVCSIHNRLFCDHIIYAKNGMFSYYLSDRLARISKEFSVDTLIGGTDGNEGENE